MPTFTYTLTTPAALPPGPASPPPYIIAPAGTPADAFDVPGGTMIVDFGRPPVILADLIDPATGDLASLFVGAHPTDAEIQYAASLEYETGAATGRAGHRFREIKKNIASAARDLENEARRLVQPFVERGDMRLSDVVVEVDSDGDTSAVQIDYVNLRTTRTES
jgi:hypothetical protein